ncbi:survivin KNAG_0D01460 [Huiozyma naganishii CBS 8797]|uniref:Uncharacterized protein n=1 Tax=Huiozyma naganishii (strain ATCC MYA-139 / BCRC 22969 / CBS 8797 / KCTC 17520 / NBRC 10181 / NCYC 3082 / Yp74L-3) TaxID=1071383 RepID=J7RK64_HUIN7|nr:hypothetical protein KNAG_0D01460 [Kazachstania naganishii CBS 8797]CCK69898.1 hypothetical protein KNAG_0D01460 [Kazachstania naganishii CBS 8797]
MSFSYNKRFTSFQRPKKLNGRKYKWRYTVMPIDYLAMVGFQFDPVENEDKKLMRDAIVCAHCGKHTYNLQNCRSKQKDKLEAVCNVLSLHLNGQNDSCPISYLRLKVLKAHRFNLGASDWKGDPLFSDPLASETRAIFRETYKKTALVDCIRKVNAGLLRYDPSLSGFNELMYDDIDVSFCVYCKNVIEPSSKRSPLEEHYNVSRGGKCYYFKLLEEQFPNWKDVADITALLDPLPARSGAIPVSPTKGESDKKILDKAGNEITIISQKLSDSSPIRPYSSGNTRPATMDTSSQLIAYPRLESMADSINIAAESVPSIELKSIEKDSSQDNAKQEIDNDKHEVHETSDTNHSTTGTLRKHSSSSTPEHLQTPSHLAGTVSLEKSSSSTDNNPSDNDPDYNVSVERESSTTDSNQKIIVSKKRERPAPVLNRGNQSISQPPSGNEAETHHRSRSKKRKKLNNLSPQRVSSGASHDQLTSAEMSVSQNVNRSVILDFGAHVNKNKGNTNLNRILDDTTDEFSFNAHIRSTFNVQSQTSSPKKSQEAEEIELENDPGNNAGLSVLAEAVSSLPKGITDNAPETEETIKTDDEKQRSVHIIPESTSVKEENKSLEIGESHLRETNSNVDKSDTAKHDPSNRTLRGVSTNKSRSFVSPKKGPAKATYLTREESETPIKSSNITHSFTPNRELEPANKKETALQSGAVTNLYHKLSSPPAELSTPTLTVKKIEPLSLFQSTANVPDKLADNRRKLAGIRGEQTHLEDDPKNKNIMERLAQIPIDSDLSVSNSDSSSIDSLSNSSTPIASPMHRPSPSNDLTTLEDRNLNRVPPSLAPSSVTNINTKYDLSSPDIAGKHHDTPSMKVALNSRSAGNQKKEKSPAFSQIGRESENDFTQEDVLGRQNVQEATSSQMESIKTKELATLNSELNLEKSQYRFLMDYITHHNASLNNDKTGILNFFMGKLKSEELEMTVNEWIEFHTDRLKQIFRGLTEKKIDILRNKFNEKKEYINSLDLNADRDRETLMGIARALGVLSDTANDQ